MKNLRRTHIFIITFVLFGTYALATQAGTPEVGTQFTYQGELLDNGSPANGVYDLLVILYDSTTGTTLLDANNLDDVSVNNGLFNVELDFGDMPFDGDEKFIEVQVRADDSIGSFEVLSPRQRINVTPYAIQSEFTENGSSPWTDNGTDISYADQVFVGTRNTISDSTLTVDSAPNTSPLRAFVGGSTRLIVRENGGVSIGANSATPDRGLRVEGDARQPLDSYGFSKAGIRLNCNSSGSSLLSEFNNQNNTGFVVNNGVLAGQCEIAVPFDISDSYIVANTTITSQPLGVNCFKNNNNNVITCSVWAPLADIRTLGTIEVLIF